jgi:hypothetical protein
MGAQSDFISESFVPSEQHRERLMTMARTLIAAGMDRDDAARMLSIPVDLLAGEEDTPR